MHLQSSLCPPPFAKSPMSWWDRWPWKASGEQFIFYYYEKLHHFWITRLTRETHISLWIIFFFSHLKPCSQDLNNCTILLGFVRPKVIKIILQSNLAKWYPKKRCAIVSTFVQKQHCLIPFQLHLAKLSFVRITPWWSSQINIFTFNGIFSFHTGLFKGRTRTSKRAEYIEWIENWPLLWSCQTPISLLSSIVC